MSTDFNGFFWFIVLLYKILGSAVHFWGKKKKKKTSWECDSDYIESVG